MVSRSLRSLLSTARRMSSVREIAAPRPRLVLKIFAPLSPLPIGHCVSSFLAIGGADPRISAFILRAAVLEASLAVVSTCCVRTVSPCVALRCTNHKRTVRKRATAAIKQSCGRSTAAFGKIVEATAAMRACNRGIPSPGTLAGDSFRPEERRLRREGAVVFCWLSLPHPASVRARHASRPTCLPPERSSGTFAGASTLGARAPSCRQANTSERA